MRSRRRPFPSTLKLFYIFGLFYFSSWLLSVSIFEFQLKSSRRINSSSKTQHQYPNNECKDFKPANAKDGSAFVNDNGRLTSSESWELLQSKRSMNGSHKKLTYLTMYGDHRAKDSFQLLPVWLQQYIKWNLRQVESISANATHEASTNSDTKYLVITCLPKDSACGGLSDRLRILPFYLLAAKLTSRLLCIYWEKPFPLEEYLQPTKYGIQWICPPEFGSLIDKSKSSARQIRRRKRKRRNMIDFHPWHRCHYTSLIQCTEEGIQNIKANDAKYIIIDMDSHSYHHINEMNLIFQRHSYYFSNRKEMPNLQQWSYPFEMGDIFRVLFKPLPILAQRVNRTMTKLGLVEKEYVSVHVRSRYPVEDVALVRERIDAIDKEGQLIFDCEGDRGDHDDRCYCTKSSSSSSLVQKRGGDTTTKYLIDVVTNAIRCGETFLHSNQKSNKIYFASDHHNVSTIRNQFTILICLVAVTLKYLRHDIFVITVHH